MIGKVQWRKDGFGLRKVDLPSNRTEPTVLNWRKRRLALICRHWQIWALVGGEARCIDRALTKKKALERICRLQRDGAPLFIERTH